MISTAGESGDEVEIAGGIFLPWQRYVSKVDDPEFPYEVVAVVEIEDGQPHCRELRLRAVDGGPPITGSALRSIPLASYLERTLELQWLPYRKQAGTDCVELATSRDVKEGRRTRRPKDEVLPKVIEEYRRALADPDPAVRRAPTQAVADRLHYERGHVSRLLSEARKLGLLGSARRGRPGEVIMES
jgi:hypothetical protein